jgi:hypothetical protein
MIGPGSVPVNSNLWRCGYALGGSGGLPASDAWDIAPIHPEAEDKNIFIDSTYQTLSVLKGGRCPFRRGDGREYNMSGEVVDKWRPRRTPGRKFISCRWREYDGRGYTFQHG